MGRTCTYHYPYTKIHHSSPYRTLDICLFVISKSEQICKWGIKYVHSVMTDNMCSTCVHHYLHTKFVIKLDSLSPIHRFIGQAMSWGKYWARRYVEPNIFPTHGETNKFVYWMKSRIQFYHYYVLRILCPISLYTFLNKQISNKREEKKKCKLTYQLWYPKLFLV